MLRRLLPLGLLFVARLAAAAPEINSVAPWAMWTDSAAEVTIRGSGFGTPCGYPCRSLRVLFGSSVSIYAWVIDDSTIIAGVPPSDSGVADVRVELPTGTATLRDGITILDRTDQSEVLIPVAAREVQGLSGMRWSVELWAHNESDEAVILEPRPCLLVPPECVIGFAIAPHGSIRIVDPSPTYRPPAHTILVPSHLESRVHFNLRVAQSSGDSDEPGTEIPVIRKSELSTGRIELLNVPVTETSRDTLRMFAPLSYEQLRDRQSRDLLIRVFSMDATVSREPLATRLATLTAYFIPPDSLGHVIPQGVISDLLGSVRADGRVNRVRVEIEPLGEPFGYWAFISITSNHSPQIRLVTPQ